MAGKVVERYAIIYSNDNNIVVNIIIIIFQSDEMIYDNGAELYIYI